MVNCTCDCHKQPKLTYSQQLLEKMSDSSLIILYNEIDQKYMCWRLDEQQWDGIHKMVSQKDVVEEYNRRNPRPQGYFPF